MSNGDLLWQHLQDLPAFRALLRAVEARYYQELLPLDEPVLDLGCGDGHFASLALPTPIAAGIDPMPKVLIEAKKRQAYQILTQSCGDALPFGSGQFATVISNSVLEHIPDVEPVIAEVERVLQPGGRFIFCVPSERFTELLFFPRLFRRIRAEGMAQAYERYFNGVARHYHCDGLHTWQQRLAVAGLRIVRSFYYFSPRANSALDLGHYLGLPSLIAKKLFGRWILVPTRWNLAVAEHWLRPLYEEPPTEPGACLFLVASKGPSLRSG